MMKLESVFSSRKHRGVSLIEYTLIGGLIAVCSIAGVYVVGDRLNDMLGGLKGDMSHGKTPAMSMAPAGAAQTAVIGSGAIPSTSTSMGNQTYPTVKSVNGNILQNVCFNEGGLCVNVPVVTSDGRISSTTGAMGGQLTQDFASVFDQIAAQLQAQGNADPNLLSLVTGLANTGHSIGNHQASLLGACAPGTSCTSSQKTNTDKIARGKVSIDSLQVTPAQQELQAISSDNQKFQSLYGDLQTYLGAHPELLPSPLQGLISTEVQQIVSIAGAYPTDNISVASNDPTTFHGGKKTMVSSSTSWNLVTEPVIVHQDANTICRSGGDTKICVQ